MEVTPQKIRGSLSQVGVLSLGLGLIGVALAIFLTTLYVYIGSTILSILAVLFGLYGATRIVCAFSTSIPMYVKLIAAYIGTTLWLTLGIALSVFSGGAVIVLWAVLSVPIVCDFLLTTVSSLDKLKQEDLNA